MQINRCLHCRGTVWLPKAEFVLVSHCNTLINRSLLCKMNFTNGFMQSILIKWTRSRAASSRFSLLHLIRPVGRIFVFIRTRQVVFLASRNDFGCSKQLALPGAEKHLPKSGFCVNYKWICDERKQQKTIKKDRTPT